MFQGYSTATTADVPTTSLTPGTQEFFAEVRSQGTSPTFESNRLTTALSFSSAEPCTAVALDAPADGAAFALGETLGLHATATCPAYEVPEFQYLVRHPGDASDTAVAAYGPAATSFTPAGPGTWQISVAVRAHGSSDALQAQSATATFTVGNTPLAIDDTLTINEDHTGTINVLANDHSPAGLTLTAAITSGPSAGTATIANGVVTYKPAHNYNGSDALSYTDSDGQGNSATGTLHITVDPVNDPPSAQHDMLTVVTGSSGALDPTLNDTDVDGDALTVTSVSVPDHGAAIHSGNIVTYTPVAGYAGSDEFQYTISDGHGGHSTASVFVTVTSSDHPPVAVDDTLSVAEDTTGQVFLLGNDGDPDGDSLTVVAHTAPAHGTVSITAGTATYQPAPDYNGTDSFGYTVADPSGAQSSATVHITVLPVNDPPVAVADTASLDEDTVATLDLVANDSDVDGDVLAIASVTQPAHGSVAIVSGHEVSYTPALHYVGADAFTYTIADPSGATATATVTLAIASVNAAPVAVDDAAMLDEDTVATLDVVANDSDPNGDALEIIAITQPAHGSAAIADAHHVTYTPAANYHGPDAFSYTIADPSGATATATVGLVINSVDDPPVAVDDAASLDEDTAATIAVTANDSDVDGDALTVTSVTQPAHGSAAIADATHVTYTPAPNYHGGDAFTYTISDGQGGTATATVTLAIASVNDAPVAVADLASLLEDGSVVIDVVANDSDVDGDPLAIASITQPMHGTAVIVDATHVGYTPAPNYNGADAFSYTIADPSGATATALVVLAITPVNDPPVASDDAAELDEDTAVTVDVVANDFDADGDPLAITAITQPAHGLASLADGHRITYVPAPNYHGPDAVGYTISDGNGGTASATLSLTVASVNDAPVAVDDAASLDEDTVAVIDVVANDSDVDGDALTVTSVTQPAHGNAAIADAHHVSYTPAPHYHGSDAFAYTISDGNGGQATASVALAIASVNDPPVATPVAATTFNDTPVVVTLAATDVDGDALTYLIAIGPAHGTLGAVAGNQVTYTPAAGFTGADSFQFFASDGQASSALAAALITVAPSVCGNGVREGREECDDGNTRGGDGCEASCKLTCGSGTGAERATVDPASGHCFAAYDGVTHSYQDAAAMCTALGGHLATITSAGEDAAAFAAVRPGDQPWLGGDDLAVEGAFHWLTGEPFGYTHFAAGKPDNGGNGGNADCLRYTADGTWTDASCATATGTLCELELAVGTPVLATGGTGARGLAIADFNGDGYPDVAAINSTSNSVGVLFGNGAGGFVLAATYGTGANPVAVAAGDFDGDGHPDLVIAIAAGGLTVLHGSATGAFTPSLPLAITGGVTAITAADLDGDGVLDLAIGAVNLVQLWHGTGTGSFTKLGVPLALATPTALAVGDFDHDGVADLAVTTSVTVLVLHGTGGGLFGAPLTLATQAANRSIAVADLDGDGALDLAVAHDVGSVAVWFGSATGGFGAPINLPVGGVPLVVAAGDFDGDGHPDLAAVTAGFATVFHGAGRTFTAGPSIATGATSATGVVAAVAANLNGDPAQDLLISNSIASSLGVLLGGQTGLTGGHALSLALNATASSTVSADFNGDGLADLAVVDPGTSKVYVFVQGAGGALTPSATISLIAGAGPSTAIAADLDGDGKLDLAIANVAFSSVSVAIGAGDGTFAAPFNTGTGSAPHQLVFGDFNGDGRIDIAAACTTGNVVSVLINVGGGHFGRAADVAIPNGPVGLVIGDFNGDTKKDLAVATSGDTTVKLVLGHNDGTFAAPVTFALGSAASAIAAGDLDGDGALDLITTNPSTNNVSILHGTGTGAFGAAVSVATGTGPSSLAVVDLDGDGHLDLVVGNAGSSDVSILHSDGEGGFAATRVPAGGPPSSVVAADLDHDGHLDLTVATGGPFVTTLSSGR
ncbi:MAG TPA: Ig-like domain-containing protein [Kofleriaceae bacterium]|nr:Ig-like domain-containing protein [Kofleriaceae bacterium]